MTRDKFTNKKVLTLKDILDIGGKLSIYRVGGRTNAISLNKLLKKKGIVFDEEKYIVYLNYSNTPQIQAVYLVSNPNDGDCKLEEIYNKLNEI